jgi:RHS repeat-associated protein
LNRTFLTSDWFARAGSSVNWIHLHQGGRFDVISGLYNFRNRDYSPILGRWVEEDPLGLAGGHNQYAARENNPFSFTDPMGLAAVTGEWIKPPTVDQLNIVTKRGLDWGGQGTVWPPSINLLDLTLQISGQVSFALRCTKRCGDQILSERTFAASVSFAFDKKVLACSRPASTGASASGCRPRVVRRVRMGETFGLMSRGTPRALFPRSIPGGAVIRARVLMVVVHPNRSTSPSPQRPLGPSDGGCSML